MTEIKRPVFMCGENPGLTLYVPGTDQARAVASYWHCADSPSGTGHALILWVRNDAPRGDQGMILTDNAPLARVLTDQLTRYFPEFQAIPLAHVPYVKATCGHVFDGTEYRVACQSPTIRVELSWSRILDRKQVLWPNFPAGEAAFDLTTVICPCGAGTVRIDGKTINGDVRTSRSSEGHPSSSAFLAFAETWIGPLP